MNAWIFLAVAIAAEVAATSALKVSVGFTKPIPSLIVVVGYGIAFYLQSLAVKEIPIGVVYTIWAGAGVTLMTLIGAVIFGQRLDRAAILGILMIVSGIMVIYLRSGREAQSIY